MADSGFRFPDIIITTCIILTGAVFIGIKTQLYCFVSILFAECKSNELRYERVLNRFGRLHTIIAERASRQTSTESLAEK